MKKIIGYIDNARVYFNEVSGIITVYGTWIMITNVTKENVMAVVKRNLKNFSPIGEAVK